MAQSMTDQELLERCGIFVCALIDAEPGTLEDVVESLGLPLLDWLETRENKE